MKKTLLTIIAIGMAASTASAVTLAHRYSFSGNLSDSAGGNTGVLQGGATVNATHLVLPGSGAGATANAMTFTNTVGIGANFAASGVTVETWYTDNNSGTWSKLFTFGTSAAGPEFAFTNVCAPTPVSRGWIAMAIPTFLSVPPLAWSIIWSSHSLRTEQ